MVVENSIPKAFISTISGFPVMPICLVNLILFDIGPQRINSLPSLTSRMW
jgi:hypothetical protein